MYDSVTGEMTLMQESGNDTDAFKVVEKSGEEGQDIQTFNLST